jgi:hypothetical protein
VGEASGTTMTMEGQGLGLSEGWPMLSGQVAGDMSHGWTGRWLHGMMC